ncbi:hypothetical protein BJX61DRAFT_396455 [Aspergillus egyptiacus]|nr:hypothetical protein BJX61DRAFT_396455 [Aspergillus egyptiacus]
MASIRTQRARLSHFHPQLPYSAFAPWLNPPHRLQLRYASVPRKSHTRPSSSAQPDQKRVPSVTSTSTNAATDAINPPPSTRPAALALPDPVQPDSPASTRFQRYIALGRAYISFYKTGLKNVYHNYRASLPIRRSLGVHSYLPTSPPLHSFLNDNGELRTTRSTFQLLNRAAYDVRRMIPFTLILIICGELTPLAVLLFGNAVTPRTCRVPRQLEKYREQRVKAKLAALRDHALAESGSVSAPGVGSSEEQEILLRFAGPEWVRGASAAGVLRACAVFGLAKSHERPGWMVGVLYRRRLMKYVEYLGVDDAMMRMNGGVSAMDAAEVRSAVEERGGVGVTEEMDGWDAEREQRRWLEKWLQRSG